MHADWSSGLYARVHSKGVHSRQRKQPKWQVKAISSDSQLPSWPSHAGTVSTDRKGYRRQNLAPRYQQLRVHQCCTMVKAVCTVRDTPLELCVYTHGDTPTLHEYGNEEAHRPQWQWSQIADNKYITLPQLLFFFYFQEQTS